MIRARNNKIAARMGLLRDQRGIMDRYFRERDGWDVHLRRTRAYVLGAARECRGKAAVVLGSGWLLDVPLDELAGCFDRLYLVDIAHPAQVRHRCRKYANVELVEADITGGYIELVYMKWKENPKDFQLPTEPQLSFDDSPYGDAFFVSVNILNQLDILIYDFLEKRTSLSQSEKEAFSRILQQKHIELLSRHESCLVSDYLTIELDGQGNELKRSPSVYAGLDRGCNRQEWLWEFDNSMTYTKGARTHFRVVALEFNIK